MFRCLVLLCVSALLPLSRGYVQVSLDSKSVKGTWKVANGNNRETMQKGGNRHIPFLPVPVQSVRNAELSVTARRPRLLGMYSFTLCSGVRQLRFAESLIAVELPYPGRIQVFKLGIKVDGTVPGGIYTDLQKGKVLQGDLLYRFNDQEFRWVSKENWTYSLTFDVPKDILSKNQINIVFHGIDTIADVYLNGKKIGSSDNMFIRYVFSVKKLLKETKNDLEVRFKSPIYEAKRLAGVQAQKYKIPPECPPAEQRGECHVNFLRKMQCSFSWDWGPAFPSVGIWKSVEIEAYDYGFIRDVTVTTRKIDSVWHIKAESHIESYFPNISFGLIGTIYLKENDRTAVIQSRIEDIGNGYNFKKRNYFEIDEKYVGAWWPSGYGKQRLYRMSLTLQPRDEPMPDKFVKELKFGLRTVELVEDEVKPKKDGYTFYFMVNNVPIFAKGSNWIPSHILPELGSDEATIRHALMSAKEANMNMLRVWGGGMYESDLFYQLADELGILIWQDMMFAVSMYPADPKFLSSVETEVVQQTRRIERHPSVVIWAGNNENEIALRGNWFGTKNNFELYKKDYVKLYVDTIEPIVYKVDKMIYYITSSPTNGLRSTEEGYIAMDPNSPLYGDSHYYNYNDDPWNASKVPNTRFASEYGFQSMPSFYTLSTVSKPEDWKLNSSFCQSRQHHRNGYKEMIHLMNFNLPPLMDDGSENFFQKFIYYSQISQAMAIKTQTEKYRRDKGHLTENLEKYTMGALYWQLNDVWQAPTWSSIEFGGRWKMLHYFAKKFFAPVIISPQLVDGKNDMDIYVASDLQYDISWVNFTMAIYSWDSFTPKATDLAAGIKVMKDDSRVFRTISNIPEKLKAVQCTVQTCFIHVSLDHPDFHTENAVFLAPFSKVTNLKAAKLTTQVKEPSDKKKINLEIKSDRIAPFVWLETEVNGQFSDNGFLLVQGTRTITFHNRGEDIDVERFKKTLKIRSLLS